MALVFKPTGYVLKINFIIGWIDGLGLILWTPRLSEWSSLATLSRRPELTWCHSSGGPRNSAAFEGPSGSQTRENEILKNFMLHGSQSTGKHTTPKRSYVLKCTSFLGLAVSVGPRFVIPHSCSIGNELMITGLHNQPHFTLLSPMQQHRPPPLPLPTTILLGTVAVVLGLGMQWTRFAENQRSQKRPALGLGEGDKPIRETGDGCLAVSPRSEKSGKRPTLERGKNRGGREHLSTASVQWKQVYATLPCLTTAIPRINHFPSFSFFFRVTSLKFLNYDDSLYHTLIIGEHNRFTWS